jgi:hypothetical protein
LSVRTFLFSFQGRHAVAWASVYATQATDLLLDAIARSDGTRAPGLVR